MAASDAEEEEEEIVSVGPPSIVGWEDMTPIPAGPGLPPIVAVQYDAVDGALLDLFAVVIESGEISERVYNLTAQASTHPKPAFAASASLPFCDAPLSPTLMTVAMQLIRGLILHYIRSVYHLQVIDMNSANYTAWEIRWRCLQGLPDLFMQKEALFLDDMLDLNPKNYQLWNYRRRFALKRGKVFEEEVKAALSWSNASVHLQLCYAKLKCLIHEDERGDAAKQTENPGASNSLRRPSLAILAMGHSIGSYGG